MRSDQLRQLTLPHLGGRVDITCGQIGGRIGRAALRAMAADFRVVILTKHAAERIPQETLQQLQGAGLRVGADHVDADQEGIARKGFDFHIAATHRSLLALRQRFAAENRPVYLVHHHADPRITPTAETAQMRAVYLGKPANARIPAQLEPQVAVLRAVHDAQMQAALASLNRYNLHYAVRPMGQVQPGAVPKPLTKAFNAAQAHSNIIIQRAADDAEWFLGADYPYLVDDVSDAGIMAVFERARSGFGGAEWAAALEAMARLRVTIGPAAIARQLEEMLADLGA